MLDDGQRGAAEATLPHSQLDHNPLGPVVIGHLAPVKNMDSHRELIQAPVLASQAVEAPTATSCTPEVGKCFALNRLVDRFGSPKRLAVLADTLFEADFRSPRY